MTRSLTTDVTENIYSPLLFSLSQGQLLEMHLLESRHIFEKYHLLDRKMSSARIWLTCFFPYGQK